MSETIAETTTTGHEEHQTVDALVRRACAIARREQDAPQDPIGEINAAHKDVSAQGRVREWWYRMRWTGSGWAYLSEERLPRGMFLASDRHATITAPVYVGDLVVTHDRGGPLDPVARLYVAKGQSAKCPIVRRRDGQLAITLPDGSVLVTPNPRR